MKRHTTELKAISEDAIYSSEVYAEGATWPKVDNTYPESLKHTTDIGVQAVFQYQHNEHKDAMQEVSADTVAPERQRWDLTALLDDGYEPQIKRLLDDYVHYC